MTHRFPSDFQPFTKKCAPIFLLFPLILGIGFVLKTFAFHTWTEQIACLTLGILFLSLYLYLLLMIPLAIELGAESIIIKRRFSETHLPYDLVKDVFVYNEVQGDIRYFSSNGFLGYMGIMGSTRYGKYYAYVKNPKQQVFIQTETKNYVLSCEDRDVFIAEVKKRIPPTL